VLAGIVAIAIGIAAPQRFLSPGDLALLGGLIAPTARWDLPALWTPKLTISLGDEAAIAAVLGILAALVLVAPRIAVTAPPATRAAGDLGRDLGLPRLVLPLSPGERVAAWAIVALALVIGWPWLGVDDPQGLGFRLRVAAFVPMALCAAIVAGATRAALD